TRKRRRRSKKKRNTNRRRSKRKRKGSRKSRREPKEEEEEAKEKETEEIEEEAKQEEEKEEERPEKKANESYPTEGTRKEGCCEVRRNDLTDIIQNKPRGKYRMYGFFGRSLEIKVVRKVKCYIIFTRHIVQDRQLSS
ncbi:histone H3.v1-like, partial [Penaeus indicus]|uniref:histone H3.v1-like n=1 Tax=Penaeus indicus TaxID=29960 RepID=UPI00300D107A